ncbi:MAG: hypothetical protein KF774_03490 [Planctomyces sp.]|nr:hypothetical protein [Planctomyces sp.]
MTAEAPSPDWAPGRPLRRAIPVRAPNNIAFRLLIPVVFVFCGTVLACVMLSFGDARAPMHGFVDRWASTALTVQVVLIGILGLTAMIVDRRRTLRLLRDQPADRPAGLFSEAAAPGESEAADSSVPSAVVDR